MKYENQKFSRGNIIFSEDGYQKTKDISNGDIFYKSSIFKDIKITNKYSVDNGWRTGNIYLVDKTNSKIKKINYEQTNETEAKLYNAIGISVIQGSNVFSSDAEKGAWVITEDQRALKYNQDLVLRVETFGFENLKIVTSRYDEYCALNDDVKEAIYLLNEKGALSKTIEYSSFSPNIDSNNKILNMIFDSNNFLWVLTEKRLFKLSEEMEIKKTIAITNYFSNKILDFDILRYTQEGIYYNDIYVTGSNYQTGQVCVFGQDGNIKNNKTLNEISYPYRIKIPQYPNSNSFFTLTPGSSFKHLSFFINVDYGNSFNSPVYFENTNVGGGNKYGHLNDFTETNLDGAREGEISNGVPDYNTSDSYYINGSETYVSVSNVEGNKIKLFIDTANKAGRTFSGIFKLFRGKIVSWDITEDWSFLETTGNVNIILRNGNEITWTYNAVDNGTAWELTLEWEYDL
jgi:hypothetical protein